MRRRMLRLHLLGLRMSWLRLVRRVTAGRGAAAPLLERRRIRTIATLATIVGFIAAAAGIQATAASWTDSVDFAIEVSAATSSSSTTTTTTTMPEVLASVSVTAVCKNRNTYILRVNNDSGMTLAFTLQARGVAISEQLTIAGDPQDYDIPNGTRDVAAVPAGAWTNTFTGTASTPTTNCQATTTTTTTTTTEPPPTTTEPPPPPPPQPATPGGITAGPNTVISDITWDVGRARQVCTVVSITGATSQPREWTVLVDLTAAPWYGTSANQLVLSGSGTITVVDATKVQITGRSNPGKFNSRTNNTPITESQTALLEICNHQAPEPKPGDSDWYTVTFAPEEWTGTTECMDVTVTSQLTDPEAFPFYFGWIAEVDLSKAMSYFGDDEPVSITFQPKPNGSNDYSVSPALEEYRYTITSGYDSALRAIDGGADSFSFTVCVTPS